MSLVLALALMWEPCPSPEAWLAGERGTAEGNEQVRIEVRRTCRALGASETACTVLDEVAVS